MAGEYFDPNEKRDHTCPLPGTFGPNKGWRCECGKAYTLESLPQRDINPGEDSQQWRRAPAFDKKKKKRGT